MWDIKDIKTTEELQMTILSNAAKTSDPLYQTALHILGAFNSREDISMKGNSPQIKAALAIVEAKAFLEAISNDVT